MNLVGELESYLQSFIAQETTIWFRKSLTSGAEVWALLPGVLVSELLGKRAAVRDGLEQGFACGEENSKSSFSEHGATVASRPLPEAHSGQLACTRPSRCIAGCPLPSVLSVKRSYSGGVRQVP